MTKAKKAKAKPEVQLPKRKRGNKKKEETLLTPHEIEQITPKQQEFIQAFIAEPVVQEAARKAGVSPSVAHHPNVGEMIFRVRQRMAERTSIDAMRVLREFARIAFSDVRNVFNPDGSLKEMVQLDDDTAASVSSVEVVEMYEGMGERRRFVGYTKKVKFWSKNMALEKLAKHLGLLPDKMDVSGDVNVNHQAQPFNWDLVPLDVRKTVLAELRRQQGGKGFLPASQTVVSPTELERVPYGLKEKANDSSHPPPDPNGPTDGGACRGV